MKRKHVVFVLIVLGTFLLYKIVYLNPRDWYNHYYFLAQSLLAGKVSVNNLPDYINDYVQHGGNLYLPFPFFPAVLLAGFIKVVPTITQQQVSVLLGSLAVGVFFILAKHFTETKKAILLTLFFAFGTVFFWASVVGTTWNFSHIVTILFFLLALLFYYNKKDFASGLALAAAALSRHTVIVGGVFWAMSLIKKPKRFIKFLLGVLPFIPLVLLYNWLRFGNVAKTGYYEVYLSYKNSPYPYTIRQVYNPKAPLFDHLDPRNIPLHLLTFFAMPPEIDSHPLTIKPSPYGMGILFTSPLLFLALVPPFAEKEDKRFIISAAVVALPSFLHYMQGWVQFGYRFSLDFMPFLLLLLAKRFRLKPLHITLLIISIAVTTWGTIEALNLGW